LNAKINNNREGCNSGVLQILNVFFIKAKN